MQQWSAGADWILKRPEMRQSEVVVTTASGIHTIQITEHIFSFMFAFARSLPAARLIQLEGTWNRANNPSVFELFEKTFRYAADWCAKESTEIRSVSRTDVWSRSARYLAIY